MFTKAVQSSKSQKQGSFGGGEWILGAGTPGEREAENSALRFFTSTFPFLIVDAPIHCSRSGGRVWKQPSLGAKESKAPDLGR